MSSHSTLVRLALAVPLAFFGCSDDEPVAPLGGTGGSPQTTGGAQGVTGGSAVGGNANLGGTGGASPATGATGGNSSASGGSGGALTGGSGGAPSATGGSGGNAAGAGGAPSANAMTFFVTSDTSPTGNLGGLAAADQRCQTLATQVGRGDVTWHAYLSTENPVVHARDRIGKGPYYNAKGVLLAMTKEALYAMPGNAELFVDEQGNKINGQWQGSPSPNEHDILTGSDSQGMLLPEGTCGDWNSTEGDSGVGHSDGLGPNMDMSPPRNSWSGAHTGVCADTVQRGGAGRIYCFVAP